MPVILYSFFAFTTALILVSLLQRQRRTSVLPLGPPGDPLIGHLLRMPTKDSVLVFHEWSKKYAAVDPPDKKGTIYSDRPTLMLYELTSCSLGWTRNLTFVQYGEIFHKLRRMHQAYLSRSKIKDFEPMQTEEARTLV
ncbi:hypothetical protein B0H14DRAFT_2565656 [Mycena olivaceomarginata]|nr:hypothetical protein B0H14DRAFT_2565656 [Mycena olivaceomarginata]